MRRSERLKIMDGVTINGTGNEPSTPVLLEGDDRFSLFVYLSGTSPDVKITAEFSFDNVENSSEIQNWATKISSGGVPTELVIVDPLTTTNEWVVFPLGNVPYCNWIRFRVTGNSGNGTDTQVSMWILKQRK